MPYFSFSFRELVHSDASVSSQIFQLEWLENYGFDKEMVARELKAGWKVVHKEDRERKEERRMFAAAWAFLYQEELARDRAAKWS